MLMLVDPNPKPYKSQIAAAESEVSSAGEEQPPDTFFAPAMVDQILPVNMITRAEYSKYSASIFVTRPRSRQYFLATATLPAPSKTRPRCAREARNRSPAGCS